MAAFKHVRSGRCRVCGCTDEFGCDAGCSWIDRDHTLCSACAGTAGDLDNTLAAIAVSARRFGASADVARTAAREARAARQRYARRIAGGR